MGVEIRVHRLGLTTGVDRARYMEFMALPFVKEPSCNLLPRNARSCMLNQIVA